MSEKASKKEAVNTKEWVADLQESSKVKEDSSVQKLFNENWKKLDESQFLAIKSRFESLTKWKQRKSQFRESLIHEILIDKSSKQNSLKGFYRLFVLGLGFLLATHPIVKMGNLH